MAFDSKAEPSDEEKLQASLVLARAVLAGEKVHMPVETQLRALAHTVLHLDDLRRGQ